MKGPKGILAQAIANALAEYFVIDPTLIETNLLSDAGVTLHEVQLRPLDHVAVNDDGAVVSVRGVVSQVAFHWKWGSGNGKTGGSTWVNSAELTIHGLKFTATLQKGDATTTAATTLQPKTNHHNDATTQASPPKEKTNSLVGSFTGYVQDQVERIIDTLRLSITDFEFQLVLPSEKALVFGGQGVQLESFGRASVKESLKQQLSIANIFASIVVQQVGASTNNTIHNDGDNDADKTVCPLLEPVSYQVECVRTTGKRFVGGVAKGLQVKGLSSDNGISIHAGKEQIAALNELAGLLIATASSTTTTTSSDTVTSPEQETISSEPPDTETILPSVAPQEESDMPSSFFELPLAALSLTFPNGTRISMEDLIVKYQMDGQVCLAEGRVGFLVNDFAMLSLGETGLWQANVVDRTFRVLDPVEKQQDGDSTTTVAAIHARHDEIQNISNGVQELLEIYRIMLTDSSGAVASLSVANPESSTTPASPKLEAGAANTTTTSPWTIDMDGELRFLLEGPDDEKVVECRLGHIHASTGDQTLTIGSVITLDIPGTICLTQPLNGTTIKFDGSLFDIKVGDIVAKLHEPPDSQKPEANPPLPPSASTVSDTSDVSEISEASPFVLPFGVKAQINSAKIYETNGSTIHTTVKALQAAVGPDAPELKDNQTTHNGGVRALLMLEEMNHDMLSVEDSKMSAIVYPHKKELVREFNFGAKSMAVAAGYSIFDWRRLFETGDQKREKKKDKKKQASHKKEKMGAGIEVPFAHVDPLKVRIAVQGDVVGTKGTTINIKSFDGKEDTVLHDMIVFYSRCVASSMPGMFKDVEFLGFNLTDTAASNMGTAVGAGALAALGGAAAPVAGVLGIGVIDGVKHAIKGGKKSRGAEEDDKHHFGDFFRGLAQNAKDDAAAGAAKRGKKEQGKADALDWALGATSNAVDYTNDNKARLGGAGAGAAGFTAGFILLGPVGGVAGALIANKATSSTIDALDSKFTKKKKDKEERKALTTLQEASPERRLKDGS